MVGRARGGGLVFGLAYLAFEPRPGDLAVHVFRAQLFGREGFTVWNGHWYGGHHTTSYSVLSGPLGWLVGPRLLLVGSCIACAELFRRLVYAHFGPERARLGALWLGFGTVTLLATSRVPFALGTAFGLAAALALQRDRRGVAVAFAFLSPLASPVAGLFTAMGGLAYALGTRSCAGLAIAAAGLLPPVLLSIAFPEGGWAPFPFSARPGTACAGRRRCRQELVRRASSDREGPAVAAAALEVRRVARL